MKENNHNTCIAYLLNCIDKHIHSIEMFLACLKINVKHQKKHRCGSVSTPTCDVTMHKMVVPYSSNVCENSLVQWNVWIHRLPRENVSTMSPALVGRNYISAVLTFCWHSRCANVMSWHYWTILVGRGAWPKAKKQLKITYHNEPPPPPPP